MTDAAPGGGPATWITLPPFPTSLPSGFLALVLGAVTFGAVQLGWIPATEDAGPG